MKIDRQWSAHQPEWRLSLGETSLGFIRAFNGTFWLYRDREDEHPRCYRSFLDAVMALEPRKLKRSERVRWSGGWRARCDLDYDESE
jgi:hypothetical protein